MNISNILYTAIFLDQKSKEKLLREIPATFSNVFADHVTLAFKPSKDILKKTRFGKRVSFNVIGVARDDKAVAVVVDVKDSLNNIPHITISTNKEVNPVYSNKLLENGFENVKHFELTGIIGYEYNYNQVFITEPKIIHIEKVFIPSRPQSDTITAIFILKEFGNSIEIIKNFKIERVLELPNDETAESLLDKGILVIDMGGTEIDHHGKNPPITCSELVAEKLGVKNDPALEKLFQFVRRDDMSGKGIISTDPIDKAFGLPGLLTALNKINPDDMTYVVSTVLPLIKAHYLEEVQRTKELPKEFEEAINSKKAETFTVRYRGRNLKVVMIETDNTSMSGFLRSQIGGRFDVMVRLGSTGHINIMTRPTKRIDLRSLALIIRMEEANQRNVELNKDARYVSRVGKISEVPNWYYDDATNSLLNGGANPKDSEPTLIDKFVMKKLIEAGLEEKVWSPIPRK